MNDICSYWFVWSSQICCYHQEEDFEILKFKSLNHPSVFLQPYNVSNFFGQHGDIEINSGPKKKQPKYFSCCLWNVSSLLAHNKI